MGTKIPADFDYSNIASLSNEVRGKLQRAQPDSIAAAKRLEGVTPAAITAIYLGLRRQGKHNGAA